MFAKKSVKSASIPAKAKFLIILQLSFAFSLLLWSFSLPFTGEYYRLRSHQLLFDYVAGANNTERAGRYEQLPTAKQLSLADAKNYLQTYEERPAYKKFFEGILYYFQTISYFEFAWIVLAIWISVLLLKGRPEAQAALWLLPAVTLFFAIDNFYYGAARPSAPDVSLFPTESFLVAEYGSDSTANLKESTERERLTNLWTSYLKDAWTGSKEGSLSEAEYNFTLARLEKYNEAGIDYWREPLNVKHSPALLGIFLLWNLFFAIRLQKIEQDA